MSQLPMILRNWNWIGHLLFWGLVFLIFCPAPLGLGAFSLSRFQPQETLWFFLYGFGLNILLFYGYSLAALPHYPAPRWFWRLILTNLAFLVVFVVLESLLDLWFSNWVAQRPGRRITTAVNLDFWDWTATNLTLSSGVLLIANFYGFTSAWFRDREKQRELEQEKLRAELTALKHQVNPHFLFNVLNSLYGLAYRNDDEPTAEGIAKLSQLMRYMLYDSDQTQVALEQEIDYLHNYLALQRLRLDGRSDLRFEIEGDLKGCQIAPMLFIPFVENAFKFGISTAKDSFVHIFLEVRERTIHFQVRNSIHHVNTPDAPGVGGIGLENVQRRLAMIYPDRYQLSLGPEAGVFLVDLTLTV